MAIDDFVSRILFAVEKELHFRCINLFIEWVSHPEISLCISIILKVLLCIQKEIGHYQ